MNIDHNKLICERSMVVSLQQAKPSPLKSGFSQ